MIFTSLVYLIFIVLVAIIYYVFPVKFRWIWLLIASIAYYLSFIPVFFALLAVIVPGNYLMAIWISRTSDSRGKLVFIIVIAINVLILAFFKYFNILFPGNQIHIYSVDLFFRTGRLDHMILPLGLSYLIFTVLSYQIEIRRKNISPETHMGYFSLYLLFFPKIAQGPIERPQNLIPMLRREAGFNYFDVTEGMKQMLWGYFKKLVVADRLAIYVNAIYSNVDHHNGTTLLLATVLFAFQIYADFSGYTDIALGSARLFGFKLTNNFRQPYLATSVKDFWDRWHISFSQWLRDYIFTPLAYALTTKLTKEKYFFISKEKWIYTIAIMITFAICGIWHGVGWTYLVWGLLFGFFLTYSNWMLDYHKKVRKRFHIRKGSVLFSVYKISVTFTLILAGWIVFRAESLTDAFSIMSKIFTLPGQVFYEKPSDLLFAFFGVLSLIAIDFKREYFNSRWSVLYNKYPVVRLAGIVLIVITMLLSGVFDGGQFIYFQF